MEESHSLISIDWPIMAIQVLTFGVMAAAVWMAAWKPLKKFVQGRQESISKALAQAEEARKAVARLEEDYQVRVKEIQQKSEEAMNAAKSEASRLRDDIIKQAHEEVLAMRRKNEQQLQEERRVVVRALRADIAQLSIAVAEKIIERSIDKSAHQQLIDDLLSKVNEKNLSGHGAGS